MMGAKLIDSGTATVENADRKRVTVDYEAGLDPLALRRLVGRAARSKRKKAQAGPVIVHVFNERPAEES